MRDQELDDELRLEQLRDLQSRRRAREYSEAFSLVERAAILLVTLACVLCALIHYPQVPPFNAVLYALGGSALIYLKRR